ARLHRARGNHDEALGALDGGMVIALDRDLERFRLALVNERIRYLIQDGDVTFSNDNALVTLHPEQKQPAA
ncbi:MAG: hypothetical protein B7X58_12945, partial [Marinobacter sp. 34-60-7]